VNSSNGVYNSALIPFKDCSAQLIPFKDCSAQFFELINKMGPVRPKMGRIPVCGSVEKAYLFVSLLSNNTGRWIRQKIALLSRPNDHSSIRQSAHLIGCTHLVGF
jgi:hypothetical protein